MFSIKKSFANCQSCPLIDAPSCILETNCEDDLTKVEVVFLAENPGKDEVKIGRPLVGKAGKLFRKYFEKYKINERKYLLTNTVLCQTLKEDGSTGNPSPDVIERCKANCLKIIETCQPKLLVVLGTTPMSALGIAQSGITKLHGTITEWNGIKTLVCVHPSFVNRSFGTWEPRFDSAMQKVAELLGSKVKIDKEVKPKYTGKGVFRYKIPEKFYSPDYRLVDVQHLRNDKQILYIFRDKKNKKVFHRTDDTFVCYQSKTKKSNLIMPFEELRQVRVKYQDSFKLDPDITYEGDVSLPTKHAIDYYYHSQGEAPVIDMNVLFLDIEVDTGKQQTFPSPEEAKFPVNLVTTIFGGKTTCFILDNKTEKIKKQENVNYQIFTTESELLISLFKYIRNSGCDFLAGWNLISFDLDYLYNRAKKLRIKSEMISPFNEFIVKGSKYFCHIAGMVPVDQLYLYRNFTFTQKENYKLNFIAQEELGIAKVELDLPFNQVYWKALNKAIEYNIRDTELIYKLEEKLSHINLLNELRTICRTTFDSLSSFGQIDSLMVSYLKDKGFACKNTPSNITKTKYPGAFVLEPQPGIYNMVTDFDFASLYPNLMITYNIGVNSFVMKSKNEVIGYYLTYDKGKLPENIEIILDPLQEKREVTISKEELLSKIQDENLVYTINGCFYKSHNEEKSIFGEVVDMLMTSRKEYKKKMFQAIEKKDEEKEKYYYTRQLVYKILANTLYGVTANEAFRFFDTSIASSITLSGQEALKTSIIYANEFLKSLNEKKEFQEPQPLNEQEMYGDIFQRDVPYIVTGDTDSIFCCFQDFEDIDIKKVSQLCSKVESFLNDKVIPNMVKKHNADLSFNRLKLKNELVISRGLFLAKKRYTIRVVSNEGKSVDKVIYMGLEIKRSDFPSKSKEFLKELVDLILKSEKINIEIIFQFISRKEKEFIKLIKSGDKSIARPVTFGKELKRYKTIPQGVRAMIAWNELMYNIHVPGSRAYMFWIKGINFDRVPSKIREKVRTGYESYLKQWKKMEVIAIPDEESKLPEWFVPDVQKTLKFVFKDRYDLLLKPVVEIKNQKDLLVL